MASERELFDSLKRQPGLKKLSEHFQFLFGGGVWWLLPKLSALPQHVQLAQEASFEIWGDPRVKTPSYAKRMFREIHKHRAETAHYFGSEGLFGVLLPIRSDEKNVAWLVLTGLSRKPPETEVRLLAAQAQLLLENAKKSGELIRLSATIRPRAVALSTVHTVHRIINSTLNLDELVSRLAHLTAQVLRVQRCAIYLLDNAKAGDSGVAPKRKRAIYLVCKAMIGYPKKTSRDRKILMGREMEGRVAQTADIRLRKKVLCIPLIDEDVIGVVTVSDKKDKKDFTAFDLEILTTLAEEAVIAIKNAQLYEDQRRVTLNTIRSLAVVLGNRSGGRSLMSPEVFARLARKTAQQLRLNDAEMQALHYASLLKETTKIGIPEEILNKPSKLTGEEISALREHTIQGAKIVQNFESLKTVAPIILYVREKFDGTGYPEGLKGEAIPIGARILAVMNAFEAIVTGRPYRDHGSQDEALRELQKNSGTQFDPRVVDAFVKVLKKENSRSRGGHVRR